jgi:hypothetical protein
MIARFVDFQPINGRYTRLLVRISRLGTLGLFSVRF